LAKLEAPPGNVPAPQLSGRGLPVVQQLPTRAEVTHAVDRSGADWLERWHAALNRRYEGTLDAAFVRLMAWCALVLVVCYFCASTHSASIVR
jgi:hypothetical protein